MPRSLHLVKSALPTTLRSRPLSVGLDVDERDALWEKLTSAQRVIVLYWMRRYAGASARQAARAESSDRPGRAARLR